MDWTRAMGIMLILLHGYLYGDLYEVVENFIPDLGPHLERALGRFNGNADIRLLHLALILGIISIIGQPGRRSQRRGKWMFGFMIVGGLIFFYRTDQIVGWLPYGSVFGLRAIGYLMILFGGLRLSRMVPVFLPDRERDPSDRPSFIQEEKRIQTPYSLNFPALYTLHGRRRKSWINIVNPFRGLLIMGSPGAGKSYFIVREVIRQHIKKGFTLFIYDFKYDDLTSVAYYYWQKYGDRYKDRPAFYQLQFSDPSRSYRSNPLTPDTLYEISDAAESAHTLLLALNRSWIRKQGDFFVESSIQMLTALIWYLRCQARGRYCTLPHLIELIQQPYATLFTLLRTQEDLLPLINPFVQAYMAGAVDQLEGQVASLRISLARLHSPSLYFLLSGDDFNLDINHPNEPKIVCLGNDPTKTQIYGAVISLFISRMIRQVNQKNKLPCALIMDELPTVYVPGMDQLMATARSNRVATCLAMQDMSQLIRDYGREQAQVVLQVAGNLICGQVGGETAKEVSERLGRIYQPRTGHTVHESGLSWNQSHQLDRAVPVSVISQLSSGTFVGVVSDNPDRPMDQKAFHARIRNSKKWRKREGQYKPPYPKLREHAEEEVSKVYQRIKKDIEHWVATELDRIEETPTLQHLIVRPPKGKGRGFQGP